MGNFLMHGEQLAHHISVELLIVGDQTARAGIGNAPDPPHMQIGDPRGAGVVRGLEREANFCHHGMVHFAVE